MDLTPLRRSREFRLLFVGQGVTFAGSMITYVALPFQAYQLTHSSLVVGALSAAELGPILAVALVGGMLADAVDRRLMLRITETGLCLVSVALLLNALLPRPRLWPLFVLAVFAAGLDTLQRPSLDALVPRLVPQEQIPAAAALSTLRGGVGMVVGPALAGVLVAAAGLSGAYAVDAGSSVVALLVLARMRAVPPPADAERITLRALTAGVRYAWSRRDLLGTYLVDMNAMLFGMPIALFPQVAAHRGGPSVLGLLYAAPSAGALAAAAASKWQTRVHRHGRAIALAAAGWGVAIVGFGFAPTLPLALAALVVAGAADAYSGMFRSTVWNRTVPDALRGRLAGIELVSYSSGPALGSLESGAVASLAGLRASIVSGGLLAVAGTVVLCGALPAFWRYDDRQRRPAVRPVGAF